MKQFYEKEVAALKRSGRYRERTVYDPALIDLASNDYLGLAENPQLMKEAYEVLASAPSHAAKASMLVNGYHPIHRDFEKALCDANGFEDGVVVGSGFSANIAMIEALVRKGDELFIDEKYHASGILATKLCDGTITYFEHNNPEALESKLKASDAKRKIIAVEGIYSMDGDLLERAIIELADCHEALLIVDEAHSSGVVGRKLMGVFDHYDIPIKAHYIKMGTLGKAYGGFGAYILASEHIIDYLINRAKPIIYATAPSLFETALAQRSLEYILEHADTLNQEIGKRRALVKEILEIDIPGLIVPVLFGDNRKVVAIREALLEEGMLVGAIRQPTVPSAIIRLIARTGVDLPTLERACRMIAAFKEG
ncbi:MAG: pyridoxal phosphate-dependent aminotransferase family protein [Sulfurimonadaceae bacterium]|nr:pyridoxal phosphate-dependent aminotransferase family protein [Sulfurimonadaceae bacterium]